MNRIAFSMLALSLALASSTRAAGLQTDPEEAVAAIEKLGGTVTIDEKSPGRPVVEADLTSTHVTDAELERLVGLRQLANLQTLCLTNTGVTDGALAHCRRLTKLKSLCLNGTLVTDTGLTQLRGLMQLEGLDLGNTKLTDDGLHRLGSLKRLRFLVPSRNQCDGRWPWIPHGLYAVAEADAGRDTRNRWGPGEACRTCPLTSADP